VITVERHATIAAPTSDVWAVLADFAAISRWAPNVDHSCLQSGQTEGIGMVRRIQSGRTTVVETVTDWEPGVSLGYAIAGLPPVVRSVTNTWHLVAAGDHTDVTLTTDVDAGPRPPHRAIATLIGRKLGMASEQMIAGLAEHIARRTPEERTA
jgi:carbon monoxide dehydrogenase subunit G